jgi:hypothetical protein
MRYNHKSFVFGTSQYLTHCTACGSNTNRKYAREHDGHCKTCATGQTFGRGSKCRDCGGPISAYLLRQGYHCDACTRQVEQGY